MNAAGRPPRRRKSTLAAEHPAYPKPVPTSEPAEQEEAAHHESDSRADAGTRARAQEPEQPLASRSRCSTAEEARARKFARDAAFGWAASMRRADKRSDEWAREMERARIAGALPGVLREFIVEAAERVGCAPSEVPTEVWQAAGLPIDQP